jgi:hypothetical protein
MPAACSRGSALDPARRPGRRPGPGPPGLFADADPGATDALLALEKAASVHPAFHDIATQFHIVGYR